MNNDSLTQNLSLPWLQKRAVKISIALIGLMIIVGVMTLNVAKYETHLATGDTVLLALAPIDPRGFMQGDYMTLNYELEAEVLSQLRAKLPEGEYQINDTDGYAIVTLDTNKIGTFSHLAEAWPDNLATNEMAIHYRIRNNTLKLATNAFFFQEGHAKAFEAAEYGLFRVNDKGEPLLTDMVDKQFAVIKGVNTKDENAVVESAIDEGAENTGRQGSGM